MNKDESQMKTPYGGQNVWPARPSASLLGPLWRRKWVFLAVLALCTAAGAAYVVVAKPVYVATAKLYVQPATVRVAGEAPVPAVTANFLNTQCELLKSRAVVEAAMAKAEMGKLTLSAGSDDPVEALCKNLDARVGRKDDIILVSLKSSDAQEAARATNVLVDAYISYIANQKRSLAGAILGVLDRERMQREQELSDAKKALVEFRRANGDVTLESEKGNVVVQRLAKLTEALAAAEIESLQARTLHDAATSVEGKPETLRRLWGAYRVQAKLPASGFETSELRDKLSVLELELANLRQQCSDDHPLVANLTARVKEVRAAVEQQDQQFVTAALSALKQFHEATKKAEDGIRQSLDEHRQQAAKVSASMCEYAMLQSRLQRAESLCGAVDSRIKELRPAADTGDVAVSIVEPAYAATMPQSPDVLRTMAACVLGGLVLGFVVALLRDRTADRLSHPQEIMRRVQGGILGAVPSAPKSEGIEWNSNSGFAGGFNSLSAAIQARLCPGAKIVQVTSPAGGEGKSTLAAGIAAAAARCGVATIIVDAAGQSAAQQDLFGVTGGQGLSDVLEHKIGVLEAVQKTGVSNLDILTAGTSKEYLSNRLCDKFLGTILGILGQRYDLVIVDSSSVRAGGDGRLVALHVDSVVLALAEGRSSALAAWRAVGSLRSVGGDVLGVVVTNAGCAEAYDDALAQVDMQPRRRYQTREPATASVYSSTVQG